MTWPTTRLRYVADLNPAVRPDLAAEQGTEVSFLPMEAIGEDGSLSLERIRPVSEVRNGYSYFEDGDVAFAKVTPCFENGKGALMRGLLLSAGFGTSELTVLRPKVGTNARFLNYVLQSQEFRKNGAGAMTGAGGLKRVPDDFTRDFKTPWPGQDEQERIANFLDEQTARIDALIAEKERLSLLLGEVVWDEVTRAVTLGLAEDRTRPSGLDWCPEIPAHWDVLLLRRLFKRTEYGISESMDSEGAVAVLRMGNICDGKVLLSDLKYVNEVAPELLLQPGDVLYNRTNSLAQVAKVGVVRELPEVPVTFASYLVRLVPNERVLPEYLGYLLNCPDVLAIARSLALPAIGQANLNPNRYGYIHVPCPPVNEQRAIVARLKKRVSDIEVLAGHTAEHISRLREYRSSLISAAVTGQLDISTFKEAA